MPKANKFRLGIVGCGSVSRLMALHAVVNPKITLSYCVDRTAEGARTFSRLFRVPEYSDSLDDFLRSGKADGLYVAVPHHLHKPYVHQCIEAGIPVLCEKPITHRYSEAKELLAASREAGLKIGVNYQYRYDRAAYRLREKIRAGQLGKIHYILCHLPWKRSPKYFNQGPWRGLLSQSGGGTLITQGSHLVDLALWMLGEKPQSVWGSLGQVKFKDVEVEDLAMGILEMPGGAKIQITSTMASSKEFPVSLEIHGSKGRAVFRGPQIPRMRWKSFPLGADKMPAKGLTVFSRSLEGFRQWVEGGSPYLCPLEDSLPALQAIEGIYESAKSGRRIFLS